MEKYRISVDQAAEIFGVSKKTVYKRLRAGELDGQKKEAKYGEQWFINESEFKNENEDIVNNILETSTNQALERSRKGVSKEEIIEILQKNNQTLIKNIDNKINVNINQSIAFLYKELLKFHKEREQAIKKLNKKADEINERLENRDQELIKQIRIIQSKKDKYSMDEERIKSKSLIYKIKNLLF